VRRWARVNVWVACDITTAGVAGLSRYIAAVIGCVEIRTKSVEPDSIRKPLDQAIIDDNSDPCWCSVTPQ